MIIPSHRRKMQTKRKYNIFCSQYALNIVSFFTLSFAFIMYQNILFHQGNKQTHNKRDRAKSLYKILDRYYKNSSYNCPAPPTLSGFSSSTFFNSFFTKELYMC